VTTFRGPVEGTDGATNRPVPLPRSRIRSGHGREWHPRHFMCVPKRRKRLLREPEQAKQ